MPGLRWLRRLLIAGVLIAALIAVATVFVEREAERRVGAVVQERFDLPSRPQVDLDGVSLLGLVRGSLPEISFTANDVEAQGLTLEQVRIELRDITLDGSPVGGGPLAAKVGSGTAEGIATEAAVNELLERQDKDATVRLGDADRVRVRARRTVAGARRDIVAHGTLSLKGSRLRFRPTEVTVDGERPPEPIATQAREEARFSVRIPTLPGDVRVDSVEVARRRVVLRARLRAQRYSLAG